MTINRKQITFAGGLVANDGERGVGFYRELRTQIRPEDLKDPMAKAIFQATERAYDMDSRPTSLNLAEIMIDDDLVPLPQNPTADEFVLAKKELITAIEDYSRQGASTAIKFNNAAKNVMEEALRTRFVEGFLQTDIPKIASLPGSAIAMYTEVDAALRKYQPNAAESSVVHIDEQFAGAKQEALYRHSLLGKVTLSLPPEFDAVAHDYLPILEKGNLYTLMGITGAGKSTILEQIAERNFRAGFRVVYFHLEDSLWRKSVRRTCRLTGCTKAELDAGDPHDMIPKAEAIVKSWQKEGGGDLIWVHCPGQTAEWIGMQMALIKGDLCIIDYAQKLGADHYKGDNVAYALGRAVHACKDIAENKRCHCVVILGSQVTAKDDGSVAGFGSSAFMSASQAVIALDRKKLGDDDPPEVVNGVSLAGAGDFSIWMKLAVTKNNDGPLGFAWLLSTGGGFKFEGKTYRATHRKNPALTETTGTLQEPTKEFYERHKNRQAAYESPEAEEIPLPGQPSRQYRHNKPSKLKEQEDNDEGFPGSNSS